MNNPAMIFYRIKRYNFSSNFFVTDKAQEFGVMLHS